MHYTQRLKDLREDKDLTQENLAKWIYTKTTNIKNTTPK